MLVDINFQVFEINLWTMAFQILFVHKYLIFNFQGNWCSMNIDETTSSLEMNVEFL